ncbi:MAG TPA: bifunctional UDP-N-acetylglucosamine diphosphorylase/glucosamine-1-phosphate N-acetyltransferase GlmU [Myxococcaceae bacterium]|nr:bifunctional UDP-N-acetylglucosamine diphosphorylase/glucosamine-1-phosphate N-acetyltransferase GlmU [Myxococcaceae bacterium]
MSEQLAAVVLCAGKGTRMRSETAKVLHPILGQPLAAWPVGRALALGCSPVVAVVGHQGERVHTALEARFPGQPLRFATQAEQRGTADAVRAALGALDGVSGPVLVLYGDTPLLGESTLRALVDAFRRGSAPLALVSTVAPDPTGYGRVLRVSGRITGIVEEKDCTPDQQSIREVNAGVYAIDAPFLRQGLAQLRPANAQGEYYLTDLVALAAQRGEVASVSAELEDTAGVNDRADLAACARVLRERINLEHMRAGVTMHDPATVTIEPEVTIGPDTVIEPGVSLRGKTRIGRGVTLGQGSIFTSTEVGDGTTVLPYSVATDSRIGPRCLIGPFARMRPGSELAEAVELGNFAETKKVRIGPGTKAHHHCYLGDSVIGAKVNVGAGTITCNYDGFGKHLTEIGDGAFIGSDSQLVAPVKVGEGSYLGAGTTLTEDVPPDTLVFSRAPRIVKKGWPSRRRAKAPGRR